MASWPGWSAGEGADLDQVVSEDAVSAPDSGFVSAVQADAVPAVASFEVADPSFAVGAPFDQAAEAAAVLDRLAGAEAVAWRGMATVRTRGRAGRARWAPR